ncbi:MAG: hypothetical protein IT546_14355 [Caulobacteraceae bacterium]|nr:hypothetical protein [Caulobacteraceae bacterium]
MAHAILAFGNRADEATLSGGDWEATLPLDNLKDRRLGRVARSASLDLADTQFDADFGQLRLFRTVAIVNHNLNDYGRYRIRLSTVADFSSTVADSGWKDAWPAVIPMSQRPWNSPYTWNGKWTPEERAYLTPLIVFNLPTSLNARYLRVEFEDPDNPDGYVQAGRLFIGDGWQPVRNMVYGAQIGWESRTEVQEAISGADYFDVRTPARVVQFGLEAMSEDEAMVYAFDLERRVGVHGECVFLWNPDDTIHAPRRQFLCRLRTLSMIENPGPNRWRAPFEAKELLA